MAKKAKVLIIDDEDVICDSCTLALSKNYNVTVAKDGESGLSKIEEIKPDIVLLDLKMPGINGMEILERLRVIDREIVTIIITGYGTVNSAVEAMKLGAYDFLTKPFTPDELRLAVKRSLEKRQLSLKNLDLQKEKERMRESFVRIVSHELKAPLSASQQNLEVILAGMAGKIENKIKEILDRINLRLKSLVKLINDWLDITQEDWHKLVQDTEKIEISKLLTSVVDLVKEKAESRKVTLTLEVQENLPEITGNPARLEEVFINLLDNGIKYNKENGEVRIKVKKEDDHISISFSDTGIGIDKEHLPFIFDEFFRVDKEDQSSGSAGLGLFIVKKIIEAHSGRVEVTSELGKGTTFTVFLPIEKHK